MVTPRSNGKGGKTEQEQGNLDLQSSSSMSLPLPSGPRRSPENPQDIWGHSSVGRLSGKGKVVPRKEEFHLLMQKTLNPGLWHNVVCTWGVKKGLERRLKQMKLGKSCLQTIYMTTSELDNPGMLSILSMQDGQNVEAVWALIPQKGMAVGQPQHFQNSFFEMLSKHLKFLATDFICLHHDFNFHLLLYKEFFWPKKKNSVTKFFWHICMSWNASSLKQRQYSIASNSTKAEKAKTLDMPKC